MFEKFEAQKGVSTKFSTRGFWFLDADPKSPIGVEAIKSGEFEVKRITNSRYDIDMLVAVDQDR